MLKELWIRFHVLCWSLLKMGEGYKMRQNLTSFRKQQSYCRFLRV